MPPLDNGLRNDLENVVKKARVIAERGATSAIESLTVHEAKAGSHLDEAGRKLRNRLRAHGRQLGDPRNAKAAQEITRLVRECAYEHWHRMLFARFLAENELLIHPEHNVSVSLDDVEELAGEEGVDQWELASRYAERMLPQIFRADDPVLAVALPRERTLELERLLESLPADTFRADDSLGWVYQFWQSEEKKRVNDSGEKITGETLPAVTQLFTEHYMVLFLLHNTIGAWHSGKVLAARPDLAAEAKSEQELRDAVRLDAQGGYNFEYLRFVREQREGDEEGTPTGPWRPAAGTFDGWPRTAKNLKVLDPCCGSGHFLLAAFDLVVRLRMAEEGLSLEDALCSALAGNLFGLELDARCTQIAAFNLALGAWRMAGKPLGLPTLNIACSGLGPHASEEEWLRLAEQSGIRLPAVGREAIKNGLLNLHTLFSKAPTLGSLIDPTQLPADLIAADYETLQPYLTAALTAEHPDVDTQERVVTAAGMVKAAEMLSQQYSLVLTNVPYLGQLKYSDTLKDHILEHFREGKSDLALAFMLRCLDLCANASKVAVIMPQGWLVQSQETSFRQHLLKKHTISAVIKLGGNAFTTPIGAQVLMALIDPEHSRARHAFSFIDVSNETGASGKARCLGTAPLQQLSQSRVYENRKSQIVSASSSSDHTLGEYADALQGLSTGEKNRFERCFWEIPPQAEEWEFLHETAANTGLVGGRTAVILWDHEQGELADLAASLKHLNHAVQSWRRGKPYWGRKGATINRMGSLNRTLYSGDRFSADIGVLVPKDSSNLLPIYSFVMSDEFVPIVREIYSKPEVPPSYLVNVPFDIDRWRAISIREYPNGIPKPFTDNPTQWVFHGHPARSCDPLQVAVARLLGYRWPAEIKSGVDLSDLSDSSEEWLTGCDKLLCHSDDDGIVCLPAVRGEKSAANRLRALLTTAFGSEWSAAFEQDLLRSRSDANGKPQLAETLEGWLQDRFFEDHCGLFHHRPFIWHIWDGRKDGFHALVNYHKLAAPDGAGRRLLTTLTHSYLGDWIKDQKHQVDDGKPGAEARLTAALELKAELEKILAGDPPYDVFVRWKPLHEQPIGWEPDINDGVRLNIRPFLIAKDVARKGAGVLRWKPTRIKWGKDRGKEPQSLRPKPDFPWFWSCDPEKDATHRKDFTGGDEFDGNRWNDLHYTSAFKQAARERTR